MTEKLEIFTQNQFSNKLIILCGCNSKTNHCKHLIFTKCLCQCYLYIVKFSKNVDFF
ncbi:hypothetical protein FWK35_00031459 [Aphis craccivora]|uniref:Uncharacterized protein n=1 Tax=Aphis craccivora TaxID=307492 RepID=A0A6G0YB66_APHCR|nr:hypothetical protein FWK35_00031459 [Aphis craccivora]